LGRPEIIDFGPFLCDFGPKKPKNWSKSLVFGFLAYLSPPAIKVALTKLKK
jgi:hypothetical protein